MIDKKGAFTTTVDVQGGKIAGLHVKHAKKGDVPVKKYKTDKKMAQLDRRVSLVLVQDQYLGTTLVGYSYIDEYGDEDLLPYDMILDRRYGRGFVRACVLTCWAALVGPVFCPGRV